MLREMRIIKQSLAAEDIISAMDRCTSYFCSVIAFGRARIVEGEERKEAFQALVDKYSGDQS